MHDTIPHKFRVRQGRNHAKHALLLPEFQVRLKPDQVVKRTGFILAAKLQHSPRPVPGAGVPQPNRLHRAETKRIFPAARHYLNRHAAFVNFRVRSVEPAERRALRSEQFPIKRLILLPVHRAVQIGVVFPPAVTGRSKNVLPVKTFRSDNRSGRVVKSEASAAGRGNFLGKEIGRQRSCGNNAAIRQRRDFFRMDVNQRVGTDFFRHSRGEGIAVDGKSAPGRYPAAAGTRNKKGTKAAHLFFQQACGAFQTLCFQRIGTH